MDLWKEIRNPTCTNCKLHEKVKCVCLIGEGPVPCDIMLIGEAPGEREDQIKKPFSGRAWGILREVLDGVNLGRSNVYISNAVKCRPIDNMGKNDKPSMGQIRSCREYLLDEIDFVQPKKIIAMGGTALKSVFDNNQATLKKNRSQILHFEEFPDIPVYASYHPAAEFYDPYVRKLIVEDFNYAFRNKKNKESLGKYRLINDPVEAIEAAERIVLNPRIALDFETTGLDHFAMDFKLLTVAISYAPGKSICIALDHPESWIESKVWKRILQYIISKASTISGHNIKYELKCTASQGLVWKSDIFDTMIAFHLLDENYPGKSIHSLKKRLLGMGEIEDDMLEVKSNLINEPLKKVADYNNEDADATFKLTQKFEKNLKTQELDKLMEFQMEGVKCLSDVEMNGIKIDEDLLEANFEMFEEKMTKIEDEHSYINMRSPDQLSEFLYNKRYLPIIEKTKTGKGSTSADTLKTLLLSRDASKKDKKFLKELLTYKKLAHFHSHFLEGIEKHIKSDGKIHPQYNIAKYEHGGKDVGTVTGRLSCINPNLQQIPRDTDELEKIFKEKAIQIKQMIISSFKGGVITQADYSQIELRLMAEYSKDKNMLEDFEKGVDIHLATTYRLIPIAPKFYSRVKDIKAKRKLSKTVNFGIIYLISKWGLAEKLEVGVESADEVIKAWFKAYSGIDQWIRRMKRKIVRDQQVRSLIGRIRRVPGADFRSRKGRELIRQGINAPIQGLAADLNLMAMIKINKTLKRRKMKSKLVGNIHDASLVDTHPKEKKEVKKIIKFAYLNPGLDKFGVTLTVPLVVDINQSQTWSGKEG